MTSPFRGGQFARVDQGVDWQEGSPYRSVGAGVVTRVAPRSFAGGTGDAVYITLDHPVTVNGRTYRQVYYAEQSPLVHLGQRVAAGQPVMRGGGAELGFASGNAPAAALVGGLGRGTQASTPGQDFLAFTRGQHTLPYTGQNPGITNLPLTGKQSLILQAYNDAIKAGINPQYFLRQIQQESGFDPTARSGAGAVGIAQIVPHYHPGVDPTNPAASLAWAAQYMAGLVHKYGGSYAKALSVYNSGNPTAYLDPGFAKGQTYNYVKDILGGAPISVPHGTVGAPGSTVQPGAPVPAGGLTEAHNAAQNAAALKLLSGLLSSTAKVPVVNPGFAPLTLPAPAVTPAALPTLNLAFQGNYGNPLG